MADLKKENPIGVFDSGIGGLTILSAIRKELNSENYIYVADQANVPYGPKRKNDILNYSLGIARFLRRKSCKLIVVACNTASAAALHELRAQFPEISIVGMEPAVKPAAEHSRTGVVGVLATPSTFEGELYASVVSRFAKGTTILKNTCPGLVEEIEAGKEYGSKAGEILERALLPMIDEGLDSIVLGCTHYPFAIDVIREIVGNEVEIFDPAPAIAKRVSELLSDAELLNRSSRESEMLIYTSRVGNRLTDVINKQFPASNHAMGRLNWDQGIIGEVI